MKALDKRVEKKLWKRKDKVTAMIERYIENPEDKEAVHDVRTSLRKLEATFSLLPKKTRQANSKYLKNCRRFFRANNKIRDYDVIKQRIGKQAPQGLVHELETNRRSELGRAKKLTALLVDPPKIRRMQLEKSKVEKRADKVAGRLVKGIGKVIPVVLEDEQKVEDLHSLRKKCKKLRYVLGTLGPDYRKKHETGFAIALAASKGDGKKGFPQKDPETAMRELQDILGTIHDIDITIEFIQGHNDAKQLMSDERQKRKQEYKKFVRYIMVNKTSPVQPKKPTDARPAARL